MGLATALQRSAKVARRRRGANKGSRRKSARLLDTLVSSSPLLANSTRHSVTSRIERNSCLLRHLLFSTRHLNATPEKRKNVEKFNTCLRFFAASDPLSESKILPRNPTRPRPPQHRCASLRYSPFTRSRAKRISLLPQALAVGEDEAARDLGAAPTLFFYSVPFFTCPTLLPLQNPRDRALRSTGVRPCDIPRLHEVARSAFPCCRRPSRRAPEVWAPQRQSI